MTQGADPELVGRLLTHEGHIAVQVSWTRRGVIDAVRRIKAEPTSLPIVAPGLVDLQVNGYGGLDVNSAPITAPQLIELSHLLAAHGVTTWMPTIITAPEPRIIDALHRISAARAADPVVGAAIPAVHIEGPFISDREGARGVHDPAFVRPIDPAEAARWLQAGPVGLVTVSPHHDSAATGIRALTRLGIVVAIGHTHADPDEITAAVEAGATLCTHLGNGITTTLPRHPNILWRQLAEDRLSAGLIADGHPLPFDTLEVMLRAKGLERALLVSDTTEIGGRPPGRYRTAVGSLVELDENNRLTVPGGELLAGAAATLLDGVRNVAAHTSFSLHDALTLATRNPARHLPAIRHGVGHLSPGAPADLIVLDDTSTLKPALVEVVQAGRRLRPAEHA